MNIKKTNCYLVGIRDFLTNFVDIKKVEQI